MQLTPGAIVQYTLRGSIAAQTTLNSLHYVYEGETLADASTAFQTALTAIRGSFITALDKLQDLVTTGFTFVDHRFQIIWATRYTPAVQTLGFTGDLAVETSAPNTAFVATKRSDFATRWGIGSWHQAGLSRPQQEASGRWNQDYVNVLGGLFDDWFTQAVAIDPGAGAVGSMTPILWGKAVPSRISVIRSASGESTIRVMRRRTVGLGI